MKMIKKKFLGYSVLAFLIFLISGWYINGQIIRKEIKKKETIMNEFSQTVQYVQTEYNLKSENQSREVFSFIADRYREKSFGVYKFDYKKKMYYEWKNDELVPVESQEKAAKDFRNAAGVLVSYTGMLDSDDGLFWILCYNKVEDDYSIMVKLKKD
jgi:uncharacterized protein YneF (UPF0154 family)